MARLGHFNLLFQRHYYALRSQIRPYLHYTRRAANTVGEGNGYGALVTGTSSDMTQKGSHAHTWEPRDFSSTILLELSRNSAISWEPFHSYTDYTDFHLTGSFSCISSSSRFCLADTKPRRWSYCPQHPFQKNSLPLSLPLLIPQSS